MPEKSDAGFTLNFASPLSAVRAWERVLDVAAHGAVVPLTSGRGPHPGELVVGDTLVARTALGPLGFDDVMRVVALERGRFVRLRKEGAVIGGTVEVWCRQVADGGCSVTWKQSVCFPWAPPFFDVLAARVAAPLLALGYHRFVSKLLEIPRRLPSRV